MNAPRETVNVSSPAKAMNVSSGRMRPILERLRPFLALVVVTGTFCVADWWVNGEKASFYSQRSLRTVAAQTATVAVAALGMTVIIIAGGIDLSVGTAIALCATVLAWSLKEDVALLVVHGDNVAGATSKLKEAETRLKRQTDDAGKAGVEADVSRFKAHLDQTKVASLRWTRWTPALSLTILLGCGCACGFLNGALVSYLKLVPFIVTLGTMQLYLGLAKKIADETTVRPDSATQVPQWFGELLSVREQSLWFGMPHAWRPVLRAPVLAIKRSAEWLGIPSGITMPLEGIVEFDGLPSGVWMTLVFAALLATVLRYTVFGRYVFALGSNEATARLCGIDVRWNKIAIYTLSGLFVGIAGLYQFSRLTVGNPTSGSGLELKVIASVVIGGASLNGGRGTVPGTLTGALIMSVITSGCTALGLTNPIQDMILGIIIVAAVTVDQLRQRRSPK
jgi:ribose/xylose/arabinose/galactoside ABC-type transport system permease subunit